MSAPVAPSVRGMTGSWELNWNTLKWIPRLSTSINRSMVAWKSSLVKTTRTNMLSIDTNDTIHRGPSFWSRLIHVAILFSELIRPTLSYYTLQLKVLTMPCGHLQQGQIQRRQPAGKGVLANLGRDAGCGMLWQSRCGRILIHNAEDAGFFGDSWQVLRITNHQNYQAWGDVSCHYFNTQDSWGKKSGLLNLQ